MSLQQGPIIVVSDDQQPAFMAAVGEGGLFPVIETTWAEASRSCIRLSFSPQPQKMRAPSSI
jgi:hypothetical protein